MHVISMRKRAETYRCGRCEIEFSNIYALRRHSKKHTDSLAEIMMLKQGHMPIETKFGGEFKGKNKIIVS